MRIFWKIKDKIIFWVRGIKVGVFVPAQSADRLKPSLNIALFILQ